MKRPTIRRLVQAETSLVINLLQQLDHAPGAILTKEESYVMNALTNAVGKDEDFRADIASVIATRLVNYSLHFAETNTISEPIIKRLVNFSTIFPCLIPE